MKATHSEEFFRMYQDELFKKYRKDCDFEYDLKVLLMGIDFSALPKESREKAESIYIQMQAKKVYDTAKATLMKKMKTIKDIKAGRASLGYTTRTQEISEWHDLNEGFEFSCLMLADFRKKYNL